MNKYITSKKLIWLLVLGQLITVLLMALGVWPAWVAWINFAALAAFILLNPSYEGLLLFLVSMAFYVVLPNKFAPGLSMWRPLLIVLFVKWWAEKPTEFLNQLRKNFFTWDWYALIFAGVIILSLSFARFQ